MDLTQQGGWGWFALALINAGLAEQKNRSRLNWFLLSLFLGPFATVYIVMTARPDTAPAGEAVIEPHTGLWFVAVLLFGGALLTGIGAVATPWLWFIAGGFAAIAVIAGVLAWRVGAQETARRRSGTPATGEVRAG